MAALRRSSSFESFSVSVLPRCLLCVAPLGTSGQRSFARRPQAARANGSEHGVAPRRPHLLRSRVDQRFLGRSALPDTAGKTPRLPAAAVLSQRFGAPGPIQPPPHFQPATARRLVPRSSTVVSHPVPFRGIDCEAAAELEPWPDAAAGPPSLSPARAAISAGLVKRLLERSLPHPRARPK